MTSLEEERSETSNRRSGWLQLSPARAVEPAYSVYDRLRHIHEAPLLNLKLSFWWIRKTFFTKPPNETAAFLVDMTKPEIVRFFGRRHFDPGWELSYNYHGEVLNLRRVEYVEHERYNWWQVHIRGFLHAEGGIKLTAHFETEPAEHPDAHIRLFGLDVEQGMGTIREILDEGGIEYDYIEPDDRGEISAER